MLGLRWFNKEPWVRTIEVTKAATHARSTVAALAGDTFTLADRAATGQLSCATGREGSSRLATRRVTGHHGGRACGGIRRLRLVTKVLGGVATRMTTAKVATLATQSGAHVLAAAGRIRGGLWLGSIREESRLGFVFIIIHTSALGREESGRATDDATLDRAVRR